MNLIGNPFVENIFKALNNICSTPSHIWSLERTILENASKICEWNNSSANILKQAMNHVEAEWDNLYSTSEFGFLLMQGNNLVAGEDKAALIFTNAEDAKHHARKIILGMTGCRIRWYEMTWTYDSQDNYTAKWDSEKFTIVPFRRGVFA